MNRVPTPRNRRTRANGTRQTATAPGLGGGVFDLGAFRARVQASDRMTVPELAEYLALGINTTYAYLKDGTIPGTRVGRRWIISRTRINAWLMTVTESATGEAL